MADQVIISGEEEVSGEEEGRYDTFGTKTRMMSILPSTLSYPHAFTTASRGRLVFFEKVILY